MNYFKTAIIWSHGPSVEAAAHRSTTSWKASVLVFLTGQNKKKKKNLFRHRFSVICPKVGVEENDKKSGCTWSHLADCKHRDYSVYWADMVVKA